MIAKNSLLVPSPVTQGLRPDIPKSSSDALLNKFKGMTVDPVVASTSKCAYPKCESVTLELKTCAACREAQYCTKEHQKNDWKRHKVDCLSSKVSILSRLEDAVVTDNKIKKINPRFGQFGYMDNCDFCANLYAYFLKFGSLGDYKEGALPYGCGHLKDRSASDHARNYIEKNIELGQKLIEAILAARVAAESIESIEDALLKEENETFYIMKGYRSFALGKHRMHSWVAFKVNGTIYHKCPQHGQDLPYEFSEFVSFAYYPVKL
ncbi:zinc finger MYND domain-containing protein [Endozoicomonas atrinae]|uniref:zinc finger MYND domain-containing protein n=1 Tax=Endozoicomonas atrinae TaxID=1333660 RepID=UPI003B005385